MDINNNITLSISYAKKLLKLKIFNLDEFKIISLNLNLAENIKHNTETELYFNKLLTEFEKTWWMPDSLIKD